MTDKTIHIRIADAADIDAIRDLTREAYAKWVAVIGREPMPMRADYAAAIQTHRFDLLYADGVLAALIETAREGDWLLIVNVAVRPGFQGRGFGVRLLTLAEAHAAREGTVGTRLYTNARFAENIRLYQSRGYAVEREETSDLGVTVHMVKPRA